MTSVDNKEISHFASISDQWWDPCGPLATLHTINPIRLSYINQKSPLYGQNVCDVGCGGGLLTEGMTKLGAITTGIDLCEPAINAAIEHSKQENLSINYQVIAVDKLARDYSETFDTVTCLEMLEHVPDPRVIIESCAKLAKPGGSLFFSTLNCSVKSWASAIFAAEYILKILPKNTHDYNRFIRPATLCTFARKAGIECLDIIGLSYNPFTKKCKLTKDVSVNYILHAKKT